MTSQLLKPKAAAEFLNLGQSTLAKLRASGDGPPFRKLGRSVRYSQEDLQAWADARVRQKVSSEPGEAAPMSEPDIIAQWELNGRECLRVEVHEFKGTRVIGIRKWFPGSNGQMSPGRDGINLNLKHLPRLAAAVAEALSKAREGGLITEGSGCDPR